MRRELEWHSIRRYSVFFFFIVVCAGISLMQSENSHEEEAARNSLIHERCSLNHSASACRNEIAWRESFPQICTNSRAQENFGIVSLDRCALRVCMQISWPFFFSLSLSLFSLCFVIMPRKGARACKLTTSRLLFMRHVLCKLIFRAT